MDLFEDLKERLKQAPDEKINRLIWQGILKLNPEEAEVVSFVFWLVYLAESELHQASSFAWKSATKDADLEVVSATEQALIDQIDPGKKCCPVCSHKFIAREMHLENLDYFSDLIKLDAIMFKYEDRTTFLWKLNGLRNHLSHRRLDKLIYENQNLRERPAKEMLLLDFAKHLIFRDGIVNKIDSLPEDYRLELSDAVKKILE